KQILHLVHLDLRGNLVRHSLLCWSAAIFLLVVPPQWLFFYPGHSALWNFGTAWIVACSTLLALLKARWSPISLLISAYDTHLYSSTDLRSLEPSQSQEHPRPSLYILTTDLTTGVLNYFSADGYWPVEVNKKPQHANPGLHVSLAVAASSSFPVLF